MTRISLFCFLLLGLWRISSGQSPGDAPVEERPDLQHVFAAHNVDGAFLVYDLTANRYTAYQPDEGRRGTLPGSTFKIVNTLIGLETGHLTSPETAIGWDGVSRNIPGWNQSHTLESAFRRSVMPYFQELARRIGVADMRAFLEHIDYGKMAVSRSTLDRFWLTGNSSVSLFDQVRFLTSVLNGTAPFSAENRAVLRFLMRADATPEYKLFVKTGWVGFGRDEGVPAPKELIDLGWCVGYLERADGHQFIFATRLSSPAPVPDHWPDARKLVTLDCLKNLGIICR